MTLLEALYDFDGRRYRRFVPFNFLLSLEVPHPHGVLVFVTSGKFIVGVVVTGNKFITVINDTVKH